MLSAFCHERQLLMTKRGYPVDAGRLSNIVPNPCKVYVFKEILIVRCSISNGFSWVMFKSGQLLSAAVHPDFK